MDYNCLSVFELVSARDARHHIERDSRHRIAMICFAVDNAALP